MKKIIIAMILSLGLMVGGISTALASTGDLAVAQTRVGSNELNPQPEPPGVTDSMQIHKSSLKLNPKPEPSGVTERKLSTSTKPCIKNANDAKNKAIADAKINYGKAMQMATQAQDKALAHAKTLTDKTIKKAAILQAHRDFAAAKAKARLDRNAAVKAANQEHKNAILACNAVSTHQ